MNTSREPTTSQSVPGKRATEGRCANIRSCKPYDAPLSLDDLRGPKTGSIELPIHIFWAPGSKSVKLDERGGVDLAYRSVIAEGTVEEQKSILNKDILVERWPSLLLPIEAVKLWQERFPELRDNLRENW